MHGYARPDLSHLVRPCRDGLVILRPDGCIRDLNRFAAEGLSYQKSELIGLQVERLIAPESAEEFSRRIQEVEARGHVVFESVAVPKEGSSVPVEVNARCVELDGESFIFCAARDISDRRNAEEAIVMTQMAVDHSNHSVFWLDMDGCILQVNEQTCRTLGYTREELVGMKVWEIDRNHSAAEALDLLDSLRRQESVRLESTLWRKDGTTFPTEVVSNHVRYRGKEWIISFARDISDRRSAEEALRESEQRLRQAIRVSQTGIFDHDHRTDTIYWSPDQRAIYGVGADDPVTLAGFLDLLHPEDREAIGLAVKTAHDPGGDGLFDAEHRIVRGSGEVRWVMTRSQTLFEGVGEARRPTRTVGATMDISERMRTEEKVAYLAFYDPLTGLANRRLLRDRLDRAPAASARTGGYGALLFIDLDHFKTINDTVGHDHGDLLLVGVAERLRATMRETDTISRPGGDEFVVILEQIGSERAQAAAQASQVSEKILEALAGRFQLRDREYSGSASIGVALFRGREDRLDELLKRSDMAMYEAKRAGRGITRFFDPHMQAMFEERARIEADVGEVLRRHQLRLYYQLRVGVDGHPLGAEALLRWEHDERGLVLPGEFIPVCEETRLILPVGDEIIVQTIIKMGQTLGLEVIAEGVETDAQLSMLERHGCQRSQGYLFGRPVPIADFELALTGQYS